MSIRTFLSIPLVAICVIKILRREWNLRLKWKSSFILWASFLVELFVNNWPLSPLFINLSLDISFKLEGILRSMRVILLFSHRIGLSFFNCLCRIDYSVINEQSFLKQIYTIPHLDESKKSIKMQFNLSKTVSSKQIKNWGYVR